MWIEPSFASQPPTRIPLGGTDVFELLVPRSGGSLFGFGLQQVQPGGKRLHLRRGLSPHLSLQLGSTAGAPSNQGHSQYKRGGGQWGPSWGLWVPDLWISVWRYLTGVFFFFLSQWYLCVYYCLICKQWVLRSSFLLLLQCFPALLLLP